jgi:hypothetical protein
MWLKEFRNEFGKVNSPVSPDVSALIFEILVRITVLIELLDKVLVGLDEEVCVTASNPKE